MTDMTIKNCTHLVSIVDWAHAGHIQQIVYRGQMLTHDPTGWG